MANFDDSSHASLIIKSYIKEKHKNIICVISVSIYLLYHIYKTGKCNKGII